MGLNMCSEKISIDWDKDGYEEFEDIFLEELQQMKGYILQAILWLNEKPHDRHHVVRIELKDENLLHAFEKIESEVSYFVEIYFEPDRRINIALMERDYDAPRERVIGFIQIPPLYTWTKEEREVLREKLRQFFNVKEE